MPDAQKRYAEAEPLLIEGLAAAIGSVEIAEAGRRLVALYEGWGKPEQAARYRAAAAADQ